MTYDIRRDHYKALKTVLDFGDDYLGWAAEFGVATGVSLAMIAERMPVIGFDSFDGLPEDWRPGYEKGMFANYDATPYPEYGNAMIVQGMFVDTATYFPFPRLSLVHIDCDLYSSTVTALEAVFPYVDEGTYIVFDEFSGNDNGYVFNDEERAWMKFIDKYSITADLVAVDGEGAAFRIESIGAR